jgi:hypothetical protein
MAMAALRLTAQDVARPQTDTLRSAYRVRDSKEQIQLNAKFAEPVWHDVDSITDFRQREPLEGAPATERTVVKIVRDAGRLYIGVRAYDSEMRRIRSVQLRRDADLSSDDNVTVLIDSYRDRRGAFLFRTNPNGAMWDGQLVGLDNVNDNWNGIWEVATRRDSISWSAEFAIPFRTLRYPRGGPEQTWGFNVERMIRRKNEDTLWSAWSRAEGGLYRVSRAGRLEGLRGLPVFELAELQRMHPRAKSFTPS